MGSTCVCPPIPGEFLSPQQISAKRDRGGEASSLFLWFSPESVERDLLGRGGVGALPLSAPRHSSGSGLVVGAKSGEGQLCLLMNHQKVTSPSCVPKLDLSQNRKVRNFIIHSWGEALGCHTGGDWRVL